MTSSTTSSTATITTLTTMLAMATLAFTPACVDSAGPGNDVAIGDESSTAQSPGIEYSVDRDDLGVAGLDFEDWAYLSGMSAQEQQTHLDMMLRPPSADDIKNAVKVSGGEVQYAAGDTFLLQGLSTPKFIPPHIGSGDRDFHGHGPNVWVNARLMVLNDRQLFARVYMNARETKSDWTQSYGTTYYHLYTHSRPIEIVSDDYTSGYYKDTNHNDDWVPRYGEAVQWFVCTGDTHGDEAGIRTGVRVYFQPVTLRER